MGILNETKVRKPPRKYTALEVFEDFHEYCTTKNYILDTEQLNEIKKYILENNITGLLLLTGSFKKWKKHFDFGSEKNKKLALYLLLWRVQFRYFDIGKRQKLLLGKEQIESFSFDQICQLFEERVIPSDMDERVEWYSYIEEKSICGIALLEMSLDELKKEITLNTGQEKRLQKLLNLIQCDTSTMPSSSVTILNSHVGGVNSGGQSTYRGGITCG